jgi:hypothetical protein
MGEVAYPIVAIRDGVANTSLPKGSSPFEDPAKPAGSGCPWASAAAHSLTVGF